MTQSSFRPISLHERFSLMRRNAGQPPTLVVAASYPSKLAPTRIFLQQRIGELQSHFPMLCSKIEGRKTTTPRQLLRERPWNATQVLREGTFHDFQDSIHELERVLYQDGQRMTGEDFEDCPLWQVTIYKNPSKDRVYISLAADHVIIDGRGLQLLFDALLAENISDLPYERLEDVPRTEDTINIKPSLAFALPLIWQHLILPFFPKFLQSYLSPISPWPSTLVSKSPIECPPAFSLCSVPINQVSALKHIAIQHDVPTFHPVIKSIYSLAIWSKYRYTLSPFRLTASTPRSERDPKLGHAYCTSNYTSSHKLDISFTPAEDFWTVSKKVSDFLVDPANISYAQMRMGILSYVPDGELSHVDPLRPTKWEDFFLNQAVSDKPFDEALNFSNLGYTKLPQGVQDMGWTQWASGICQAPLCTTIIGHERGLRLGTVWRDGAAVTEKEVKDIEKLFKNIVGKLIQGKTTIEDLLS
ncbi:uncharacterized protein L203_105112 [Cryptococcus depauperatus CBS 7841]|uniref:Uncharacterized protein n=1 Tax=Cryptococcus depauperatus CBS 7841 TaxID=1295531 RepID=A0A1E3HV86_9TREE|nr:hypothetical protein L203_05808 [Cryptococcus depauperatus CBS 7841]